jgi:hypothetical protein
MNSFAIDLHLWIPEINDWVLVPARGSLLKWPAFPGISQETLLSSTAGISFRVDDVLWLGNERDSFPLEMVVDDLSRTLIDCPSGELMASMADNEFLSVEFRQDAEGKYVLISRTNTREVAPGDYLEQTARYVGSYYKDFPVELTLWKGAVRATLGGLTDALISSPLPGPSPENEALARGLLTLYGPQKGKSTSRD